MHLALRLLENEYRNHFDFIVIICPTLAHKLGVGYSMIGKKIFCMSPPSVQKFDLEDTGKLVAIVAASEMTREYLIKQKILPDHINI